MYWHLQAGACRKAAAADLQEPLDTMTAAGAAATDNKEVMLAVANLRAAMTLLPTLLLR
jgi:hypothetical protein